MSLQPSSARMAAQGSKDPSMNQALRLPGRMAPGAVERDGLVGLASSNLFRLDLIGSAKSATTHMRTASASLTSLTCRSTGSDLLVVRSQARSWPIGKSAGPGAPVPEDPKDGRHTRRAAAHSGEGAGVCHARRALPLDVFSVRTRRGSTKASPPSSVGRGRASSRSPWVFSAQRQEALSRHFFDEIAADESSTLKSASSR